MLIHDLLCGGDGDELRIGRKPFPPSAPHVAPRSQDIKTELSELKPNCGNMGMQNLFKVPYIMVQGIFHAR
ncbi:MAG: hypothetical protein ABSE95_02125 [Thermodesulfobacteriota bacterium]|jgi:hypothetical protein